MSHDEDFQNWIKDVMPKIIENLGLDVDKVQYKVSDSTGRFSSIIYYILLQVENKTNEQNKEFSLVLKKPMEAIMISYIDFQFHNEILFYQMYTQPEENYARCIYVDERPPNNSVIALENVSKRGYHPYPHMYNIPLEYTLAAMREIGRFHGKGYVMKEQQRNKFFAIVEQLEEVRYLKTENSYYKNLCNVFSMKMMEYLRNHDAAFYAKTEPLFSNAFDEVMLKIVEPLEPLSTLCHGDFTLDNILFNTEDGQYRTILIDFGLLRYSTPVIDLSTYICLHCSNEMIKEKFFDMMRAYHDALKEYLLEAGVWDNEKYSYEAFLADYRRGGLFGFVIATFYLPMLLGYYDAAKWRESMIRSKSVLEFMKQIKLDDEFFKTLVGILLTLRDLGCL